MSYSFGPGDQRAVTGDFVVLDGLSGPDNRSIQNLFIGDFACQLVGLADQAVNRRTFQALRLFPQLLKDLIETRDLVLGLLEMVLQALDRSRLVALSISFGSDFTIWFSA